MVSPTDGREISPAVQVGRGVIPPCSAYVAHAAEPDSHVRRQKLAGLDGDIAPGTADHGSSQAVSFAIYRQRREITRARPQPPAAPNPRPAGIRRRRRQKQPRRIVHLSRRSPHFPFWPAWLPSLLRCAVCGEAGGALTAAESAPAPHAAVVRPIPARSSRSAVLRLVLAFTGVPPWRAPWCRVLPCPRGREWSLGGGAAGSATARSCGL